MYEVAICKTCRFWHQPAPRDYDPRRRSSCRFMPPHVASNGATFWPETYPGDWCGKHERKDDALAKSDAA